MCFLFQKHDFQKNCIKKHDIKADKLDKIINESREKLFKARESRIHPLKDDKILTDWNGLMIASLARAGQILNDEEYINAAKNGDMIEVADALGDLMYILFGTIMRHGMQHKIVEVFEEIQKSNMSKLGKDGKPIYREDGKVLKGPNYFKPNIQTILNK